MPLERTGAFGYTVRVLPNERPARQPGRARRSSCRLIRACYPRSGRLRATEVASLAQLDHCALVGLILRGRSRVSACFSGWRRRRGSRGRRGRRGGSRRRAGRCVPRRCARRCASRPRRARRCRRAPNAARAPGGRRAWRSPSRSRSSAACSGVARSIASATSSVRLPSRRSSPAGLPVSIGSPHTPRTSSRSWNASPIGNAYALSAANTSGGASAAAAPRCSGPSTVYLLVLNVDDAQRVGRRELAARLHLHVEVLAGHHELAHVVVDRAGGRRRAPARANSASAHDSSRSPSRIAPAAPNTSGSPVHARRAMQRGERRVRGRIAAAGVRSVHQVVVDERAAVQQLEARRRRRPARRRRRRATARQPQYANSGRKPLAAVEHDAPRGIGDVGQFRPDAGRAIRRVRRGSPRARR